MKKLFITEYQDKSLVLDNGLFFEGLSGKGEVLSGVTTTTTAAPTTTTTTTTTTVAPRTVVTADSGTGSRGLSENNTLQDYIAPWWLE
jgi:hypothetical protein